MEDFLKNVQKSQEELMPQIKGVIDEIKVMNTPVKSKTVEINDNNVAVSTHANNKVVIVFPDQQSMNKYFDKVPVISAEELVRNGSEMNLSGRETGYKHCNKEWLNKPWYKRLFTKWQ